MNLTIEQIITSLEARAEGLREEHERIERALSELRPEHAAEPAKPSRKRRRRSAEDVRTSVAASLRAHPDDSFTIEGMAALIDYDGKAAQRALLELVDAGLARTTPSTAGGWPSRFPRYQYTPPLAAQLTSATKERA